MPICLANTILSATGMLDEKIRPEFKTQTEFIEKVFVRCSARYLTLSGFAAMNFSQEEDDLSPASGFII